MHHRQQESMVKMESVVLYLLMMEVEEVDLPKVFDNVEEIFGQPHFSSCTYYSQFYLNESLGLPNPKKANDFALDLS